ncbi:MAG: hypothetical protein ACLKAO_06095 [Alkaliphilus sp.]
MSSIISYSKKILFLSFPSILIISTIALVYSLISSQNLVTSIFDFNYFSAAIILSYGVIRFLFPIGLSKKNKLVDHSNYVPVMRDKKDKITYKSIESVFWGISNIIIVSTVELVFYYLSN